MKTAKSKAAKLKRMFVLKTRMDDLDEKRSKLYAEYYKLWTETDAK